MGASGDLKVTVANECSVVGPNPRDPSPGDAITFENTSDNDVSITFDDSRSPFEEVSDFSLEAKTGIKVCKVRADGIGDGEDYCEYEYQVFGVDFQGRAEAFRRIRVVSPSFQGAPAIPIYRIHIDPKCQVRNPNYDPRVEEIVVFQNNTKGQLTLDGFLPTSPFETCCGKSVLINPGQLACCKIRSDAVPSGEIFRLYEFRISGTGCNKVTSARIVVRR